MKPAPRQSDVKRHQDRIGRHTRFVAWMKIVLPVLAILMIGLIFLSSRERGDASIGLSPQELARLGAGLKLENARFSGMTEDGDPFVVTAVSALPDGAVPDRIDLDQPAGEIKLGQKHTITVSAETGRMHRNDKKLDLNGKVIVTSTDGYRMETDAAGLDFKTRSGQAPGPVRGQGPGFELEAGNMRIDPDPDAKNNVVVQFGSGVRVVYDPKVQKAQKTQNDNP